MLHENMLDTILAFDAYDLGAMDGHVIKTWTRDMASELKQLRAQLATLEAEREVLAKVESIVKARDGELEFCIGYAGDASEDGEFYAYGFSEGKNDIGEVCHHTITAALAALVAAAEEGK